MPLEQAREYLARVLPWDDKNFVGVHYTFQGEGYDKPRWSGSAARDLDGAMRSLAYILKRSDTRDIYACLSTQIEAHEKTSPKGYKYFNAIRSQKNAVALKSLFLDLDAKGQSNDSYNDLTEATDALCKFLSESGMPRPTMVVGSGGGMHVYWLLNRALTPDEWRPLAYALAEATKRHGLKCDTQCTIDSARVLRIPDTLNCKSEPKRSVSFLGSRLDFDYAIERITKALEPYKVAVPVAVSGPVLDQSVFPKRQAILGESELSSGIEPSAPPPVHINDAARECAFIRETIADGGLTNSQPLWNLTTLLATFTDDPRNDTHRMSRGHPDYTKEKTDEFFDRKDREQKEKGLGWPSCSTISASGARQCAACPHFQKNKTPYHFIPRREAPAQSSQAFVPSGLQATTSFGAGTQSSGTLSTVLPVGPNPAGPAINDLPDGYMRDARGIISLLVQDEAGTQKFPVTDYRMDDPWLQVSPRALHFTTVTDRGKSQQITIHLEHVGSMEMRRILQDQGLMLPVGPKATENVTRFFVSWIKKLQETKDSVSSSPFGWHVRQGIGKLEGFVYGGKLWTPAGDTLAAAPDTVLARHYAPTGDEQSWVDACRLITSQGRPELEAIVASAFGAPLVRFTGQPGVLMSAFSKASGIGKSTSLKIAQAVWGDPVKAVQSLSDTQNAVMNKLGEIRSLPLYWDELKTEDDTKKFVNITFQTTQGKEKARMSRSVTQREPGSWQTLLVSASNDSLLDYVIGRTNMTTAGIYRVFEYSMDPPAAGAPGQIEPSDASLIVARLNDNYGQVGLKYAQFLGQNHATIEKEVGDFLKAFSKSVGATADERFWTALIACVCMGAKYANQLGVATFNEDALKSFMVSVLGKMRSVRVEQPVDMDVAENISNVIAQYLNAMRSRHTLITNRVHIVKGKPQPGTIKVVSDASRLDGIYVHLGQEDKVLRISSISLSEWLREKGYSRHIFTEALKKEFGVKSVRGRIGSGTSHAGATEYLLEIQLAGHPLLDFIDEA